MRLLAAAAIALVTTMLPAAAHAHNSLAKRYQWAYVAPGSYSRFCVIGNDGQNHGSRYMETAVFGVQYSCGIESGYLNPGYLKAGNITHKMAYYKTRNLSTAGTFCFEEGWYYNGVDDRRLVEVRNWDVWPYCNYGTGAYVWITVDNSQYAHAPFTIPGEPVQHYWWGTTWAPSTAHCHCP